MPRTDHQTATACGVGLPDAGGAHDDAPGGEIRALDMLHQVKEGGVFILQHPDAGADDLPQVVGRNIGGHAHGDAGGAVDQKIGEPGGKHSGLLPGLVEVGVPIHGLLVDVPEHFIGKPGEPGLGITIGRGRVAVHGAKVSVAVHQLVAHGEVLGQPDHGVVGRRITVGMIPAQHVAHAGGGLLKGLVRGQIVLIHGVEDPPVDRLQTVPDVGQGPAHNDAHGIFDIAGLHLLDQFRFGDDLIREGDVLRLIVSVVCHCSSLLPRCRC